MLSLLAVTPSVYSQDNFYDFIELGDYSVGFSDTLLIDETVKYQEFGYDGGVPLFVNIWHPIEKVSNPTYLSYADLRKKELKQSLKKVYETLESHMDSAFTWYNVEVDFDDYENIDYGDLTPYQVQEVLKTVKTKSQKATLPEKSEYPVIFYHHGAQGLSDENYLMAEYFASHGYLFVSANFHWPFKDKTYGFSSLSDYNNRATKRLIEFSKSISNSEQLYFIGHS